MRLHEARGAGDDHAADRVRAGDVRIVVDLDPPGGTIEAEGLSQGRQQLALGGGVGEPPGQGLLGVALGVVDEVLPLAAARAVDLHTVLDPARQRGGHQLRILDEVAGQDRARRRLVVVELSDERAEHLVGRHGPVGLREIGPVAPVLEIPEEEHLDAELAGLLVEGEHVGLLDALGVDALHALDRRERRDPVAEAGGTLELHRFGRRLHLGAHPVLHGVRLAGQEGAGRIRHGGVILRGDLARAGTGAALDLEEQAGPGAVLVVAVGAGAQQEGALQGVHRPVHRPDAREGAVIVALPPPRPPVLDDLRGGTVLRDQDVGEGLVVPHQHVEAGLELLDQVGFEEQRLGFGRGGDEFHRRRLRDHPGDAVRMRLTPRVGAHPGLQVLGLADVEDVAAVIEHPVDAG